MLDFCTKRVYNIKVKICTQLKTKQQMETIPTPTTGLVEIKFNEVEWRLMADGVQKTINCKASMATASGEVGKISLRIHQVIPPEKILNISPESILLMSEEESSRNASNQGGMERAYNFLSRTILGTQWILLGHIIGRVEKPIIIYYLPMASKASYAIPKKGEVAEDFFPNPN